MNNTPSISEQVVETVADEADVCPTELTPLYEVVDPDCLNNIFCNPNSVRGHGSHQIKFTFEGYQITVTSNRSVEVTPLDEQAGHSHSDTFSTGEPETPD